MYPSILAETEVPTSAGIVDQMERNKLLAGDELERMRFE
jgi:hypothetical protein